MDISSLLTTEATAYKTELLAVAGVGVGIMFATWGALRAKGFFKGIAK